MEHLFLTQGLVQRKCKDKPEERLCLSEGKQPNFEFQLVENRNRSLGLSDRAKGLIAELFEE